MKKRTHPRSYDLYDIFYLYLLKEGCTWRAIPHDYSKWQNMRYHCGILSSPGEEGVSILDKVLRKLVEAERTKNSRSTQTTMLIVDSKNIQNADSAEEKTTYWSGYFKATSHDYGDNITDHEGAINMVDYYCDVTDRLSMLKKILADGGYIGENFAMSALLPGLINAGDFGKIANPNYKTLFKCVFSLSSALE